MESSYKCFVDIKLDGGDIWFDVSDGTQVFSFKSGVGFLAIPDFLSALSSLYKKEMREVQLDCYGNFDYYIFSADGLHLFIEHIGHYPEGIFEYQFELKEYMKAVAIGFKEYLYKLETESILPLKSQEYGHLLGDDVLNVFDDFISLLRH